MNPLELTKEIVQYILAEKKGRSEKAIVYLRDVATACRELSEMEDVSTDAGTLLHERFKCIYDDASRAFPHDFDRYGFFVLFNALSAARVYYWIRRWENAPDASLELAHLRNFREDLYEGSSPDSLAADVRDFLKGQPGSAPEYREALKSIKWQCLHDIAQLDSFIMTLTAK